MGGKLANEIKQTKPFASLAEEALLNIHRTASHLNAAGAEVLKPFGLTGAQYNILRILRGAGKNGLGCREIGDRMINLEPDITRLLDRLESRKLIERDRSIRDRRVVITRITEQGLKALQDIDPAARNLLKNILRHLGARELRELIGLLEKARLDP